MSLLDACPGGLLLEPVITKVIDTEVIPDPNAIFREIWRKAGDRLDGLTTV